jgi:uncharacterized membrane protein YphA (DoxX/SURF4 family)
MAPKKTRRHLLQRLFPAFPGGLPGIALLLFRAVFALSLLLQAGFYLREADGALATWFVGLAALAAGALLLIGFLTPVAGAVVGLGAIGVGLSLLPPCAPTLFDSRLAIVFAVTVLVGIVVLGPGAFSVDARVFGRREIIIPPPISPIERNSRRA